MSPSKVCSRRARASCVVSVTWVRSRSRCALQSACTPANRYTVSKNPCTTTPGVPPTLPWLAWLTASALKPTRRPTGRRQRMHPPYTKSVTLEPSVRKFISYPDWAWPMTPAAFWSWIGKGYLSSYRLFSRGGVGRSAAYERTTPPMAEDTKRLYSDRRAWASPRNRGNCLQI